MELSRRQFTKVAGLAAAGTMISTGSVWASNSNTLKQGWAYWMWRSWNRCCRRST